MEQISFFNRKGCSHVLFFNVEPPEDQVGKLSGLSINTKVLADHEMSTVDIMTTAEREGASLILVNIGRDWSESALSTVTIQLIKTSSLPLLFTKSTKNNGRGSVEKGLFSHSIFATDWSSSSQKALRYLLEYKDVMDALEVIHVINDKLTVKDMRELKERLDETRKLLLDEGVDAEAHVYAGKTGDEIIRAAREYKGTIIALGKGTAKSFWKSLFRDNSLITVIRDAHVPVLVIP
jgi:nucleotide-binding universal stress UspA family protein